MRVLHPTALSPLPTDTVAVAPQGGSGVTEADVNGATIKAQQSEIGKAREHVRHALHCQIGLEWECEDCELARAWLDS